MSLNMDFSVNPKSMERPVRNAIVPVFKELEDRFGPMDARYRLADVSFFAMDSTVICPLNDLSLYIHKDYVADDQWVGVLAHEAVHCLGHVTKPEVTFLEEGVAELFSVDYFSRRFPEKTQARSDPRYHTAAEHVRRLEAHCPGIIFAVRTTQPALSKIIKEDLERVCPTLPENLAEVLVSRFYSRCECPQSKS